MVWSLRDNGTVIVPEQQVDPYSVIGGVGTWGGTEQKLTVMLDRQVCLIPVSEDGYVKLHCPLLNQTLVRCDEREAAYEAKFVDVTLTDGNVWEYFALEQVPAPVDENGARIWKEVFVMTSPVYGEGLVYWSEKNVEIDFVYWTTYRQQADKAPYGVNFYVDEFNSVTARGTLTFVKADHVSEYRCDGDARTVVLKGGARSDQTFTDHRYDGYPY